MRALISEINQRKKQVSKFRKSCFRIKGVVSQNGNRMSDCKYINTVTMSQNAGQGYHVAKLDSKKVKECTCHTNSKRSRQILQNFTRRKQQKRNECRDIALFWFNARICTFYGRLRCNSDMWHQIKTWRKTNMEATQSKWQKTQVKNAVKASENTDPENGENLQKYQCRDVEESEMKCEETGALKRKQKLDDLR